ncbi:MAG: hypothetical protein V4622_03495 [Bacteroidota bacterium]
MLQIKKIVLLWFFSQSLIGISQINWNSINSNLYSDFPPSSMCNDNDGNLYMTCTIYDDILDSFIHKILVSSNSGLTWNEINTSGISPTCTITNIAYFNGKFLISTVNFSVWPSDVKILESTDNGQSWTISMQGYDNFYAPQDIVSNETDIFIISYSVDSNTENKLFKSSDGGENWIENNIQNLPDSVSLLEIAFCNGKMIIGTKPYNANFTNNTGGKLFISNDEGLNWIESNTGYDTTFIPSNFLTLDNGEIYLTSNKHDIQQGGWIFKIFKSTDQGQNWFELNNSGLTDLIYTTSLTYSENYFFLTGRENNSSTGLLYRSDQYSLGIEKIKKIEFSDDNILKTYDLSGKLCSPSEEFLHINLFKNGKTKFSFLK